MTTPESRHGEKLPQAQTDDVAYLCGLLGAFIAGGALVLLVALAGKNESLRDELRRERETPTVVVVKGGGNE